MDTRRGGPHTRITWVGTGATEQGRDAPHMWPEDDRIYVWAGREGLLSMRYDGTDVRSVVKVSAPKVSASFESTLRREPCPSMPRV